MDGIYQSCARARIFVSHRYVTLGAIGYGSRGHVIEVSASLAAAASQNARCAMPCVDGEESTLALASALARQIAELVPNKST